MRAIHFSLDRRRDLPAVLFLILIGGALLRFYHLAAESLWFDEAYSVWVARHSVGWHIALSTQRIFPPLYYLLLHFWLSLGSILHPALNGTEFWIRALSVFIGLGSIVAIYALARQLFDARVGLISAILLAISPLHIWYSQEARMYILCAALGAASAYFMLLALRVGKAWHWMAYVITTALAMNAHYFSIFLVPFQNAYVLYLVLRSQTRQGVWRSWLLSQVAVGVLSVIGLAGIFSSESGYWWGVLDAWHGAPTWRDLAGLLFSFSLGTTAEGPLLYVGGLLLFGLCAVWSVVDAKRRPVPLAVDDGLVFAGLFLVVPVGTVFLLSQFRSFWVLRYIFPFLPPYCIILARGISRMPGKVLVPLMAGAIVLACLWPIASIYRYEQKENWRGVAQYIVAGELPNDLIVMVDEDIWLPFEHYYRGSVRRMGVSRGMTDRELLAARIGVMVPGYSRIWLVLSHTDNYMLKDYLKTSRFAQMMSEKRFTGVEVDLFAVQDNPVR